MERPPSTLIVCPVIQSASGESRKVATPFLEGLNIGSDKKDVINLFGKPKRSFSHLSGEILNFDDSLIIITDQEGKVEKVINFKEILKP